MLEKFLGVVLRTVKYKDNAFMADVYTETMGRVSFVVTLPRTRKAVLKPVLFQPLAIVEIVAEAKPGATVYKVKEAKSAYPFASLPYHPYKSAMALFLAEFLGKAVREEGVDESLFAYLHHSVVWLDRCESNFSNFHLVFVMRISRFLGLLPNLDDYTPGCCFDMLNACFTTSAVREHGYYINKEESAALYQLMRMNYDTMSLFKLNRVERGRCLEVMCLYYRLHIPEFSELKSLEVLRELFV